MSCWAQHEIHSSRNVPLVNITYVRDLEACRFAEHLQSR